ncbi:hypothetical protein BDQ17DRAFT_1379336, partial [Cyathus striatus]
KLGAVLGTTPFLLSPPPAPISIPSSAPAQGYREPPTPRTKKSRRTGRGGGIRIRTPRRATGYHYHHLDISLPSNHEREAIKISLVPSFPGSKPKKTKKGGKALPPPLLLRLRAVPVPSGDPRVRDSVLSTHTTSIKSKSPSPQPSPPPRLKVKQTPKNAKNSRSYHGHSANLFPQTCFPPRTASPSAELLRKQVEKPQGPRLSARERRVRREGKKRAVDCDVEEEVKVVVTQERERARSGSIPILLGVRQDRGEIETPPTSTDDSQKASKTTSPPLSPSKPYFVFTNKALYSLSAPARPRTTSSGNSRTSEDKTHHRMHTHADRGLLEMREREWSGEWNVRVGDVRRMLRELKAR